LVVADTSASTKTARFAAWMEALKTAVAAMNQQNLPMSVVAINVVTRNSTTSAALLQGT